MAINSVGYLSQINRTQRTSSALFNKIASGSKYPSASYGTSAYAISVRAYSKIGALAQSNANTQNANAMLATAAGGVSSTISALSNLRQMAVNAANGTNATSDVSTLNNAINQTLRTIDDNASIQYNGMNLLQGGTSVTIAGVNGYQNVSLGNMTSSGLGLVDAQGNSTIDLSTPSGIEAALGRVDYYDESGNLMDPEVGKLTGRAVEVKGTIDKALDQALDQATTIGAAQQNLTYSAANYATEEENLTAATSTMSDTDIARTITELNSANTQNQLALYAQKMFMHNNASVLALLN